MWDIGAVYILVLKENTNKKISLISFIIFRIIILLIKQTLENNMQKELNDLLDPLQRQILKTALLKAADELGVDLKLGHIRFDAKGLTIGQSKVSLRWDSNNVRVDAKYEEFKKYCASKGVPLSLYGHMFRDDSGEIFRVSGIKPRGRKNTLEITRVSDDKVYICPPGYVRAQIAYTPPQELAHVSN
jgi:hypothetical protein